MRFWVFFLSVVGTVISMVVKFLALVFLSASPTPPSFLAAVSELPIWIPLVGLAIAMVSGCLIDPAELGLLGIIKRGLGTAWLVLQLAFVTSAPFIFIFALMAFYLVLATVGMRGG